MNFSLIFGATGRLQTITQALCRAVAAGLGRGLMDAALILLVWKRIRGVENRLQALVERLGNGRLRVVSGSCGTARAEDVRTGGVRTGGLAVLPRREAWLAALLPGEAACLAGQLRLVLAEPGMIALLLEVPQAVRILTPLCRMLGVERSLLRPAIGMAAVVADVGPAPAPVAWHCGDVGLEPLARDGGVSGWLRFIPG